MTLKEASQNERVARTVYIAAHAAYIRGTGSSEDLDKAALAYTKAVKSLDDVTRSTETRA